MQSENMPTSGQPVMVAQLQRWKKHRPENMVTMYDPPPPPHPLPLNYKKHKKKQLSL